MPSLPVVDIAAFLEDPSSNDAQAFIAELREHLHMTGFVYLTGHGVDPALDQQLLDRGAEFFALPEAERRALAIENSAAFRGYTTLGDERTQGQADWRDQLDYGPEQTAPEPGHDGPAWLRLRGPNQWPEALPELAPVALAWMEALHRVGVAVVEAIALGLGQPVDRFASRFVPDHDLHVKIIRYPVNPAAETDQGATNQGATNQGATNQGATNQGVGLHHDTGVATFILQSDVAGLQVMIDGELVTAEPMPGSYILNLGAMLQTATSGYLKATPHQVVSPTDRDRLSVALFFNPTFESTFEPVELPAELAAEAHEERRDLHGEQIHTLFGENNLKVRLRSHPDVARNHYADVAD